MKPVITLGSNICRLRREAHITQGDLASFLGVTKASVSKWETGQSYPDLELLPRIATYFSTTIDELVGYQPQLDKGGIARECARLRAAFADGPFDQAHRQCQELVRDYYACYPLIAQIALIYLNHWDFAKGEEREELVGEAIGLCHRVKRGSESSADIKLAEAVEAAFLLASGDSCAVVEILGETPEVDMGTDILLASAYGALGRLDEADMTLQGPLFESLALALNRLSQLAMLYASNPGKLEVAHERAMAIVEAFDMEKIFVNTAAVHLSFATAFVAGGNVQRCLDCLEDYERACKALDFPIKLHGDAFFDKVVAWLEMVNTLGTSVPRDEALVKKSMLESVSANPAFAAIAEEPRFRRIVANLERMS